MIASARSPSKPNSTVFSARPAAVPTWYCNTAFGQVCDYLSKGARDSISVLPESWLKRTVTMCCDCGQNPPKTSQRPRTRVAALSLAHKRTDNDMEDTDTRVHGLEVAMAAQEAAMAGAEATQGAVTAGMTATNTAMAAGNMATMIAGGVSLVVGIFLGLAIASARD